MPGFPRLWKSNVCRYCLSLRKGELMSESPLKKFQRKQSVAKKSALAQQVAANHKTSFLESINMGDLMVQVQKWTTEWLKEVCGWVDEQVSDRSNPLVLDIEYIDQSVSRLGAEIAITGQAVAKFRMEEELQEADLEAIGGTKTRELMKIDGLKVTEAKLEARADEEYQAAWKKLIFTRCERRCLESILEGLRAKLSCTPGVQGASNAIRKLG